MDLALEAQTNARKDRLARLRDLKRKQGRDSDTILQSEDSLRTSNPDASTVILSGRNYDVLNKTPRLGFDTAPSEKQETLEQHAASIAVETRKVIRDEDQTEKSIDLLSLQPKKPNWDLKRDVNEKLVRLEQMTNNSIARLLRDRILQQSQNDGTGQVYNSNENLVELVRRKENESGDVEEFNPT
ncbi:hypothetical protein TWF694_001586 [Orbilia ellipsospora]|uniref:Uncharacterized protein n=1 Tax=Orbilia ellipsospora TaxID=2528407 RepID=A0AAV9X2Z5_9PEZI